MSNISDFNSINTPDKAYLSVNTDVDILFENNNNITKKAFFLMIRAHSDNDLLIEILPYGYGVYIPAGEMWSVDSIKGIEGFKIKKAFNPKNNNIIGDSTPKKVQWMIGYR